MEDSLKFNQSVSVEKVPAEQVQDSRIQNLASSLNVNWTELKEFLSKFKPALREAVMVILEQVGWLPVTQQINMVENHRLVAASVPPEQLTGVYSFQPTFWVTLIERVGPILANILIEMLRNHRLADM